ncbi:hypothetical protein [Tardiphaga sp.]|jgi:hypothetical protein|uniref:hypothetical protein n=1 Tax=Tardiphaga sp. TaxID=1926292 RepID=UPI0037D9C0E2
MDAVTVRLHYRKSDGTIEDAVQDYSLESFAGFLPAVGDTVLDPGVTQGLDRREPSNRRIWTVVQRMFNPRDLENYVALVVEERAPLETEHALLPSH